MKVIDCNTGIKMTEKLTFINVMGTITVKKIYTINKKAFIDFDIIYCDILKEQFGKEKAEIKKMPLKQRWNHPEFPGQHVAFFES